MKTALRCICLLHNNRGFQCKLSRLSNQEEQNKRSLFSLEFLSAIVKMAFAECACIPKKNSFFLNSKVHGVCHSGPYCNTKLVFSFFFFPSPIFPDFYLFDSCYLFLVRLSKWEKTVGRFTRMHCKHTEV